MMACVTGWFDTHRSLAVSLVSAGMGMAPMTMSPLAAWLVSIYDWRTSLLIIAAACRGRDDPGRASGAPPAGPRRRRRPLAAAGGEPQSVMSVGQALQSPQFIILLLTNFFCCATHSGPIFHTVSYAVTCGIPMIAAVSIYSVEGLAGMGGRIAFGILGDRFGAKRVLVLGLLLQAFGALAYVFVQRSRRVLRGGGAVRLHLCRHHAALCRDRAREFPAADDGDRHRRHGDGRQPRHGNRALGRRTDLRHLRELQLALYRVWGMGLGAFLIAMTFRPFPKEQKEQAAPLFQGAIPRARSS